MKLLGTFVNNNVALLQSCRSWDRYVEKIHGPPHLQDKIDQLPHPAAPLLASLRDHGVPVLFDDRDWTLQELDDAVERGCNQSATFHKEFIAEEMVEFMKDGYWTVLPYHLVRNLPGLRLSPSQIKEERDRKPRFIADHRTSKVNDHTLPTVAPEAMQFGGTLFRVAQQVHHANPQFGPVHFSKFDLKDAFYKFHTRPQHAPKLAVILPRYQGMPPLIAIPLVITMGWTNSPPTCCSLSETICDDVNSRLYRRFAPGHRLEPLASPLDDFHPCLGKDTSK